MSDESGTCYKHLIVGGGDKCILCKICEDRQTIFKEKYLVGMFGPLSPTWHPTEGQNESAIIAEDLENPEILASHSRHAIRLVLHKYHALALPQFYFPRCFD